MAQTIHIIAQDAVTEYKGRFTIRETGGKFRLFDGYSHLGDYNSLEQAQAAADGQLIKERYPRR